MTEPKTSDKTAHQTNSGWLSWLIASAIKIMVMVLIVLGAMALYRHWMVTSPRAKRQTPQRQAKLVRATPLQREDCRTIVEAMGPVVPAQQVTLQPQVSGRIMEIAEALIPGGIVQADEKLITIDPRDYEVIVQQQHAQVSLAQKNLKVEQGNQAVAQQEYELLGEVIADEDRELVLREPQLASAQAALESAEAALMKAQLDLARCTISVPFNAIIQEKRVDLGATVSLSTPLATLTATDEAWIELKVPTGELQWITIPQRNGQAGSSVRIYNNLAWGPNRFRTGRVVRLYGELESKGKLAQLLVAVDDPFCLKPENQDKPKLLIGSFVNAQIEGHVLDAVFSVKWPYLRDNNSAVWIVNDSNELEIRPVEVVFSGPDKAFIREGLTESDRLVLTDIAAPVVGMPLRLAESEDKEIEPEAALAANEGQQP